MSTHTHQLAKGQWICDNDDCRQKLFLQIEQINAELQNEFHRFVETNSSSNRIDFQQAWRIVRLTSGGLAVKLASWLKNENISSIIDEYAENPSTQKAFRQAFDSEGDERRSKKLISEDQLWQIYQRICRDAIEILSKTPTERTTHVSNFLVFDQNTSQ